MSTCISWSLRELQRTALKLDISVSAPCALRSNTSCDECLKNVTVSLLKHRLQFVAIQTKDKIFSCEYICCSVCGVYQPNNALTTRWGTSYPPEVCVHWMMRDGVCVGVRLTLFYSSLMSNVCVPCKHFWHLACVSEGLQWENIVQCMRELRHLYGNLAI